MEGPAAEVSIKGETNIIEETQNIHVVVNPRISDSLSLLSLAGGPLAGAAAFVAQKILKDPLNKICLLYTSPSPRDGLLSRMPSSA